MSKLQFHGWDRGLGWVLRSHERFFAESGITSLAGAWRTGGDGQGGGKELWP